MLGVDARKRTAMSTKTQGHSREEGTGVDGAQKTWAGVYMSSRAQPQMQGSREESQSGCAGEGDT